MEPRGQNFDWAVTCAAPGTVALTFDDGPERLWTSQLLDLLRDRSATATFFVDAQRALATPELVAKAAEDGHEIGLHCFEHVRHSTLSASEIEMDTAVALDALDSIGLRPAAWRTPWGDITDSTLRVAAKCGLTLWGWSDDTHDWRGDACEEMLASFEKRGGLSDRAVVLMHDGIGPGARRSSCAQTLRLTEALLDSAEANGLSTSAVSELHQGEIR